MRELQASSAPPPPAASAADPVDSNSPIARLLAEEIVSGAHRLAENAGESPHFPEDIPVSRPRVAAAGDAHADATEDAKDKDAEAPPAPPSSDPRIAAVATALATGDWRKVAADLGALDAADALPPTLRLVCAVAHHETGDDASAQPANDVAIAAVASMFGVPADSPLAVVIAKRTMRKNPTAWRQRPAPSAGKSILIVLATLIVGGALGWLFSSGIITLHLHRLF